MKKRANFKLELKKEQITRLDNLLMNKVRGGSNQTDRISEDLTCECDPTQHGNG